MSSASKSRFQVVPAGERSVDGKVFASRREYQRYVGLKMLQTAGAISGLECQPAFDVLINGLKLCRYKADFRYLDNRTGKVVIEDVKSTGTLKDAAYRLRKKAAELSHGINVTEVIA